MRRRQDDYQDGRNGLKGGGPDWREGNALRKQELALLKELSRPSPPIPNTYIHSGFSKPKKKEAPAAKQTPSIPLTPEQKEANEQAVGFLIVCALVCAFFYGIYAGILYLLEKAGLRHAVASPSAVVLEIALSTVVASFFVKRPRYLVYIAGGIAIGGYLFWHQTSSAAA